MDYMIRAVAADERIRAFAITARDTVEEARKRHALSPVATAAVGRLLCGAAMMSMDMKDPRDLLTIQVIGDGPIGGITTTASPEGVLKSFANVPGVELEPKYKGKLDVGRAVGAGVLRVMKDTGGKEPYIGTVELISGEIAEDLTYYFAQSEQIPSSVALGVLVDVDRSVACAGGLLIQLMPDATDSDIDALEENIKKLPPITDMLSSGRTPEEMLTQALEGFEVHVLEKKDVSFRCDCGRDKIIRSLLALNKKDLEELLAEGKPIEVGCQFCGKKYEIRAEELGDFHV